MQTPTNSDGSLIRIDLREPAFRRYETFIAQAALQYKTTISILDIGNRKPSSFVLRFTDAVLAYRRYKYPSTLIPPDANLSMLRAKEMADGTVVITNHSIQPSSDILASDKVRVHSLLAALTARTIHRGVVKYSTPTEHAWLMSLSSHPDYDISPDDSVAGEITFY